MSDTIDSGPGSTTNAEACGGEFAVQSESLRGPVERLRALQSAWGVLAPSCLSSSGRAIVEAGRASSEELALLSQQPDRLDPAALFRATSELDRLAASICSLAFEIPTPQLQSTLPGCLLSDRRGLLDLLDLLAGDAFETADALGPKLGTIDYLITLLCTEGDTQGRATPNDPVVLTPGFREICRRAETEYDEYLPGIEAEFFAAANVEADLRDEVLLRGLRARKAELGKSYFAPRMLRAIVTYNVALMQCVAAEVWDSRDWGERGARARPGASVFESDTLRSLHEAVRRRLERRAPETSPVGRIAWALDLDYLNSTEKSLLLDGRILSPEDLPGTIVLVGLLCRSLTVLAIELQAIGISPDEVSGRWVKELDELLKGEVNERISTDTYQKARALSELRNKFLYAPMMEVHRGSRGAAGRRPRGAASASDAREVRKAAKELTSAALVEKGRRRAPRPDDPATWRDWPWRLVVPAGLAAAIGLLFGLHWMGFDLINGDLDRFSGSELESVSPHLVRGHRNGDGAGSAFVGTIDAGWLALGEAERRGAAEHLVDALRQQGVTQVMIYDDAGRLRIQSLGQRVRTL